MLYRAINISKYIVNKCIDDKYPISNLQLQKILFNLQKEFLKNNIQLFSDDFEAWRFGPVIPYVYYYFCANGAMPITDKENDIQISDDIKAYIDRIVETKRILKPWDLVMETHKPKGAWDKIYASGTGNKKTIPVALIQKAG